MSLYLRVAQISDLDEIFSFENEQLILHEPDESERMLKTWNSRWRKESLEHYLQLGWSFVARDTLNKNEQHPEGKLVGYFLAQALLFFDGQTQTLWIEHISFRSFEVRDQLCELAYKLGREKHLQRVYFPNNPAIQNVVHLWKPQDWKPDMLLVKTTKT